jgi:hypothetical protein
MDVSADGAVVVGRLLTTSDFGLPGWASPAFDFYSVSAILAAEKSHAMIWDAIHGTRLVRDVLANQHDLASALQGWSLLSASAISGDGRVLAGVGVNPSGDFQGWIAITPEPAAITPTIAWFILLFAISTARYGKKD